MTDNGKNDPDSEVQNQKSPTVGKVSGMELQSLVLLAVVVLIIPAVLATPVGAGSSGSTWWNKSGNYYAGGGIYHGAQTCGQFFALGIHIDLDLENSTLNGCIGGQEFFVPNDNNDDALPSYVLINIDDEDAGSTVEANQNSVSIGANDTGASVAFYQVDYPHGDDHPHKTLINFTTICSPGNVTVPNDADMVRVNPDGEPVTAMKDCGSGPEPFGIKIDPNHAGAFGTKGKIYANFSE